MPSPRLQFFHAFLDAISAIEVSSQAHFERFKGEFVAAISGLDPIATIKYAEGRLDTIALDAELVSLFDAIRSFQEAAFGEGFAFAEDHELVTETYVLAVGLSGKQKVSLSFIPLLITRLENTLAERSFIDYIKHMIAQQAGAVHEYRLRKLEEAASHVRTLEASESKPSKASLHEFTVTQQALAIHYLIYEALGVTGIDTTKLIALAHLMGAKRIPQKNGKDNLDNSGIKSAFSGMWQKEDKHHLADLNFVLRFLKPLDVEGADGIRNAINAIERRIEKVAEKLSRNKD